MKAVSVKLFRPSPPFTRRVRVGQITVGGFMDLVRQTVTKVAEIRIALDKDITGEEILRSLREPDLCAIADAVCIDQEPEFLRDWMTLGNVRKILYASTKTNNWLRLLDCINLGPSNRQRGSIVSDITALCRIFPGLTPPIVRAWPMEEFLDVCESLNLMAASEDPTLDESAQASPLSAFAGVRGVQVIH